MGRHPFNKKYNLIYIKGSFFKVKGEKAKLFPSPNKRCTLSWYSHYTEYVWHHKWSSGKPYIQRGKNVVRSKHLVLYEH